MSDKHPQSDGLVSTRIGGNFVKDFPLVVNGFRIPDFLLELALCQTNKEFITDPEINDFVERTLLPVVRRLVRPLYNHEVFACANHVHIGDQGLGQHDHRPHAFTSVLFLTGSKGTLVVKPDLVSNDVMIDPEPGLFVVMLGVQKHQVFPSPMPELRVSLVTNYEYRRTQAVPAALPDGGNRAH